MKKILSILFLSFSMFTAFAGDDEDENRGRGRGRGRGHDDDIVNVIPETSTYAAIGFVSVVLATVIWKNRVNKK